MEPHLRLARPALASSDSTWRKQTHIDKRLVSKHLQTTQVRYSQANQARHMPVMEGLWKSVVGCCRMLADDVGCCRIEVVGGASVCAWRSTEHVRRRLSWKRSLDPCCFRDGCPPRQQPHTLHTHIPEVRLAASTTINNSLIPHWGKVKDATDRLLRVDLKKTGFRRVCSESDQDQLLQVLLF